MVLKKFNLIFKYIVHFLSNGSDTMVFSVQEQGQQIRLMINLCLVYVFYKSLYALFQLAKDEKIADFSLLTH